MYRSSYAYCKKTIVIDTNLYIFKNDTHDMFETLSQLYNAGRYKHRFFKSISHENNNEYEVNYI